MHKKGIFFLIPHLSQGGQERVASRLSLKLSDFYEIYFLLFENKIDYSFKGKLINLKSPATSNFFTKIFNVLKRKRNLKKILEELNPIAVISFGESANLINLLTSKKNAKSIISIRQDFFQNFELKKAYKIFYQEIYRNLYKKADKIVTVSKKVETDLVKIFKIPQNKLKTIYNPIEVEYIRQKAEEDLGKCEFLKNHPYLITVGRLTKAKGQWYLLRIFKHLKEKHKDLKLLILGEGELKNYLLELSENLGLKTYVWDKDKLNETYDIYFLGFQINPYKFIKYSKLFIFTSLREGFPNVLIETLAVGKLIISTDCRTGPREILAPKTDFLSEAKEPQMEEFGILMPNFEKKLLKANESLTQQEKIWIDFLNWLLDNDSKIPKYEAKAIIRANDFNIDKIIQEWIKLIEE